MQWLLLLADLALAGLLVRLWSSFQTRSNALKQRQQAACQRTAETALQIESLRKEIQTTEAQIPEIEAQAQALREEVTQTNERLARAEALIGD